MAQTSRSQIVEHRGLGAGMFDALRCAPRPAAQPARGVSPSAGARASPLATRQALSAPHRCGILAPNAREEATLSPQEVRTGDPGQAQAARGGRVLQAPQCVAASLSRQKPERLMALVMVLPVGWLVSAAGASRRRQALKDPHATCPNHKGQRVQHPTARGVCQYFGGRHVLRMPGPWDLLVGHLTEQQQQRLELLGKSSTRFYR
jgi:hypothetical protein